MTQNPQFDSSLIQEIDEMFGQQEANIEQAVRSLKVIAHPSRLKILCILRLGEQTVQNLERYTGIAQATLSQHLSVLKDRGVLASRREGNFSFYRVANDEIVELFNLIRKIYCITPTEIE